MSSQPAAAESALYDGSAHGVFTRADALRRGMTRDTVRHRISSGRWVRVAGEGYCTAETAAEGDTAQLTVRRAVAANLTWAECVVAYRTAAVIHGLPIAACDHTHVVLAPRRTGRAGLRPHLVPCPPEDISSLDAFRVTTRSRTIVDCLALLPRWEAEQLLAWVRTRELIGVRDLEAACAARRGRWGVVQLREITEMAARGALSGGEVQLHDLLTAVGITGWEGDQPIVVGGHIVARADILFRRQRLIVELDSVAFHTDLQADRQRLNALALAGYTVLSFTWNDVVDRPYAVVAQIRAALRKSTAAAS